MEQDNKKKRHKIRKYISFFDMFIKAKRYVGKHIKIFLFICIVSPFIIMAVNYCMSADTAKMTLTLNYENATKGLTPNGIKFNMFEIASENIMKKALDYAGITNVTAEELSDCVNVVMDSTGTFSGTDESTYYIATVFNITYKQPKAISDAHISPESMLGLMGKAYKSYFLSTYTQRGTALDININIDDDMEYMEEYEYFVLQANQVKDYLNQRSNENSTFESASTGETFLSVKKKVEDYISVSLNKCQAYILENGLAKNRQRYVDKLEHLNSLIDLNHLKRVASYNIRNEVIDEYDGKMISTVLVPTEDVNFKYYMSKTQTGIDYLAVDASNDGTAASDLQKMILTNNSIIKHMKSVRGNTTDQIDKVNNMMDSLKDDLKNIVAIAKNTDQDYILNETNDYLIQDVQKLSFIERINVKVTAVCAFICWLVVIAICYRYEERKKDRSEIISDI